MYDYNIFFSLLTLSLISNQSACTKYSRARQLELLGSTEENTEDRRPGEWHCL